MKDQKKLKIMVLFGGRSGEHEVSLRSALSVMQNLDTTRFEVIPVLVDKRGRWLLGGLSPIEKAALSLSSFADPNDKNSLPVTILPYVSEAEKGLISLDPLALKTPHNVQNIDVVFPVMHGSFSEDGTIQGFLELADIAYVGSGVLASAVGMDKDVSKRLAKNAGIPVVPYISLRIETWEKRLKRIEHQVAEELGYPVFVKPANLGSSVGISKVKAVDELRAALETAFSYDVKVLVERAISARELEFAVLENSEPGSSPLVSSPGEIIPTHEFYSYAAKYLDEKGAKLVIPAPLDPHQVVKAGKIVRDAFEALECEGMARVDLFLDKQSGSFYFNELNTIPGFTSISMYPKLWEYSGISYQNLLTRLIDLAIARHERKKHLKRDFHSTARVEE